jgi:hypothetical protein
MKRIKISLFKGKDYDVLITKHSKNLISIIIYVVNYVLVPQPLIFKGSMTYKLLGISLVLVASVSLIDLPKLLFTRSM